MKSITADIKGLLIQSKISKKACYKRANSFCPLRESKESVRDDGSVFINDICYSEKYPNSFFDVFYPQGKGAKLPTLIYFHGGGYIFGSKTQGDPFAAKATGKSVIDKISRYGFNIINVDYCFAPKYRFPHQLIQISDLLAYLNENSKKLSLDMTRLVIMGSSAGACFAEIIGLISTNGDYARRLGIEKFPLKREHIKALVIDECSLNLKNLNDKNSISLYQIWLGEKDLRNSEKSRLLRIPDLLDNTYPPSFIVCSNIEKWFYHSGLELKLALDKRKIENEFYYVDESVEALEHGFLNRFEESKHAKECLDKIIAFICKTVK